MGTQAGYTIAIVSVIVAAAVTAVYAPAQVALTVPLFTLVAVNLFSLLQGSKAAEKVADVAVKVEKVAEVASAATSQVQQAVAQSQINGAKTDELAVAMNETREVSKATHVLVNHNMMIQLELTAQLSRWKADHEPSRENIEAANLADHALEEHRAQQAKSDLAHPPLGFGAMPAKTETEAAQARGAGHPSVAGEAAPGQVTQAEVDAIRSPSPPAQLKAGEVTITADHVTLTEAGVITEMTPPAGKA